MQREIGDIVNYRFKSEYRGVVYVKAVIIQIYSALYHADCFKEMSIRYEDLGDMINVHGIPIDSPYIE